MATIELTPQLQGDLGELYFKHFTKERNYAYIKLEDIYNTLTLKNELVFRNGFERLPIKIPDEIIEEVRKFAMPIKNYPSTSPGFIFDFLTLSLWPEPEKRGKEKDQFHWVEIKTGNAELSEGQKQAKKEAKLQVDVFRVIHTMPKEIDIKWESRS
ncbi:MAG TPA: hypothetical protein VI612_03880 [Candidatus Nanoarchaeia archaeon]|nr:hypothetical protein [Candidatus Nanoarchaeia archaeon]